jgi:hypothetical protein
MLASRGWTDIRRPAVFYHCHHALDALKANHVDSAGALLTRYAPAPIDEEATCRTCKTAEAVTP